MVLTRFTSRIMWFWLNKFNNLINVTMATAIFTQGLTIGCWQRQTPMGRMSVYSKNTASLINGQKMQLWLYQRWSVSGCVCGVIWPLSFQADFPKLFGMRLLGCLQQMREVQTKHLSSQQYLATHGTLVEANINVSGSTCWSILSATLFMIYIKEQLSMWTLHYFKSI